MPDPPDPLDYSPPFCKQFLAKLYHPRTEGKQIASWLGIIHKREEEYAGGGGGEGSFPLKDLRESGVPLKGKGATTDTTSILLRKKKVGVYDCEHCPLNGRPKVEGRGRYCSPTVHAYTGKVDRGRGDRLEHHSGGHCR